MTAHAGSHAWWDGHMREIVRGATTAFVVKGLSALLLFASQVVIARVLGPADAGLYFLAFTVMTIAAMLGRVGLDNTVLRFVAGLSATEEWPAVRGVYRRAIAVGLAASGATALLLGLAAPWAAGAVFGKPELAGPLLWMALGVVPTALFTLQAQALQGLKRLGESNLIGGVVTPALLCVGVLLLGARRGALGPAWAYVVAALLTAAAGAYLWRRAMASHPGPRRAFPLPTLLESSVPLFWVSVFQLVITWTSTVALGILGTTTDVAIFGAANRTAALTSFVLLAVNSISAPKFAALHRAGDLATMGSIARKSARLMAILASPVLALFVLAPGPVLRLFGDEFVVGAPVLTILALGQFVNVVTGSVGWLLIMSGNERLMRNNIAVCAVLALVSNVLLIPPFGVVGAAIATAVTLSLQMLIAAAMVRQKLGVVTLPLWPGQAAPLGPQGEPGGAGPS